MSSICFNTSLGGRILGDWIPPPLGTLKLNFDGSSKDDPGLASFVCVVRDC